MAKAPLSPRERLVLDNLEGPHEDLIKQLKELEDKSRDLIDILYLDTVIGQEQQDIKKRREDLIKELQGTVEELNKQKSNMEKPKRSFIIR